jgi:transcriptional regulator with XRE-family HTH domain
MRAAREAAGISLRKLACQLGYHSHTTLSSYERGAVMPTEAAVTGYERVLGLKPGTLTGVLEQARIERHGDAWAKRRIHIRPEFMPEPEGLTRSVAEPVSLLQRWRDRWQLIAGCAAALVIVGLVADLLAS